jgi:geranylgeranyl diphosphate synthase type I
MGWVDEAFRPALSNPGKLIRPALVILAFEAVSTNHSDITTRNKDATHIQMVLPVAAAVQFTHEFTLIHDDIEDMDEYRRNRKTVWKVWGIPQGINTGDAMFAYARCAIWDTLEQGVSPERAIQCAQLLDHTCISIAEGQFMDIGFENRDDVSVALYMQMIKRKTAFFLQTCAQMGALLGTDNPNSIEKLADFGLALGMAFQIRDDILGTWASQTVSGKKAAGDIIRHKKNLPVIYALANTNSKDQHILQELYALQRPLEAEEIHTVLAIFAKTGVREVCEDHLTKESHILAKKLAAIRQSLPDIHSEVLQDFEQLVEFVSHVSI